MNICFASAAPYLPQLVGGLNANTHELAIELRSRNETAYVLARLSYGNMFGARHAVAMKLRGEKLWRDEAIGYPVFRSREPWRHVGDIPRPDVFVLQETQFLRMAGALGQTDVPVVAYFHGLEFETWDEPNKRIDAGRLPIAAYVVNSDFSARRFFARHGIMPAIVNPVCRPERYRCDWKPSNVTFINPVKEKGLELALDLARACPEIPFTFVKAWPLSMRKQLDLSRRLQSLPNVRLLQRARDMRPIYSECKILLAPSLWEGETWGRVASEAQLLGIPVVGTNRGGLPESIGDGGVLMPTEASAGDWAAVVRRLWRDDAFFQEKSQAALRHSQRPAVNVDRQVDQFLKILARAASAHAVERKTPAFAETEGRAASGGDVPI